MGIKSNCFTGNKLYGNDSYRISPSSPNTVQRQAYGSGPWFDHANLICDINYLEYNSQTQCLEAVLSDGRRKFVAPFQL